MKYCPYCGNKLNENDKFCGKCGSKLKKIDQNKETTNEINKKAKNNIEMKAEEIPKNELQQQKSEFKKEENIQKNTNVYANIGLILSLVSILCCGLTAPISLIASIIGIMESKNKDNAGFETSLAGIIISSILILLTMVIYSIGKIIIANL